MADTLTELDRTFLKGLHDGDPNTSGMMVKFLAQGHEAQGHETQGQSTTEDYSSQTSTTALTEQLRKDFTNFEEFLIANGCQNPQDRDRYLVVKRADVLDLLQYIDSKECLILQNCFGFDLPISQGGQMQLVHKGNFWLRPGITEADIFNSVYKKIEPDGQENFELFLNINFENRLSVETGRQYLENFRANYPKPIPGGEPYTRGYLLPVRALIAEFQNTSSNLGTADYLTFRWGLTSYNGVTMGDITLVVGTDNLTTGSIIIFRKGGADGTDNNYNDFTDRVPCPPTPGCEL